MNILNERFWVSRNYQNVAPSEQLLVFVDDLTEHFYNAENNRFDYHGFATSSLLKQIEDFLPALHDLKLLNLSVTEREAFWLNIYNLLAIHLVVRLGIEHSVRDEKTYFSDHGYNIDGFHFSLDVIEHGIMRSNAHKFRAIRNLLPSKDPRLPLVSSALDPYIHFAFYCACHSSPYLQAYSPKNLRAQLKTNAVNYLNQNITINAVKNVLEIPKVFDWYKNDFSGGSSVIHFIQDNVKEKLGEAGTMMLLQGNMRYQDFDWSLNSA